MKIQLGDGNTAVCFEGRRPRRPRPSPVTSPPDTDARADGRGSPPTPSDQAAPRPPRPAPQSRPGRRSQRIRTRPRSHRRPTSPKAP